MEKIEHTIVLRRVQEKTLVVKPGDSVKLALDTFSRNGWSGWKVEAVDGQLCLGLCEACEGPVLEGQDHAYSSEDGVYLCKDCMAKEEY